ncbi:hypothetical protein JB92DRAFT_2922908 [Gautieria morchelliformis]|nr:hypothetical protein JB92DRAFT_2922908 [Gautieria morchelliformis]
MASSMIFVHCRSANSSFLSTIVEWLELVRAAKGNLKYKANGGKTSWPFWSARW